MDEKQQRKFAKDVGTKTVQKKLGGGKKNPSVELEEPILEKVVRKPVTLSKTLLKKNGCKSKYSFLLRSFCKFFSGDF